METLLRDFVLEDELGRLGKQDLSDSTKQRKAPPASRRLLETISNADRLERGEDYVYDERPHPLEDCVVDGEIDRSDVHWASSLGLSRAIRTREGATFTRIAEDVYVISVAGGQYLHDDRHLADMSGDDAIGLNEHSWYLVALPSPDQMLLVEVANGIYEHLPFQQDGLLYMNTVNRHLVSRRDASDMVVLVQVSGYGPEERDLAVERLREVLASRPDPIAE